jgi:hypothetical protein
MVPVSIVKTLAIVVKMIKNVLTVFLNSLFTEQLVRITVLLRLFLLTINVMTAMIKTALNAKMLLPTVVYSVTKA